MADSRMYRKSSHKLSVISGCKPSMRNETMPWPSESSAASRLSMAVVPSIGSCWAWPAQTIESMKQRIVREVIKKRVRMIPLVERRSLERLRHASVFFGLQIDRLLCF